MIQVKKITYTPANIYAMFATPQMVLPAPPAGFVNNILSVTHDMTFNTLAYTGAVNFRYGLTLNNTVYIFIDNQSLAAIYDINYTLLKQSALAVMFSTTKAFYITTNAAAATGNSNIDAYIIYETKALD